MKAYLYKIYRKMLQQRGHINLLCHENIQHKPLYEDKNSQLNIMKSISIGRMLPEPALFH